MGRNLGIDPRAGPTYSRARVDAAGVSFCVRLGSRLGTEGFRGKLCWTQGRQGRAVSGCARAVLVARGTRRSPDAVVLFRLFTISSKELPTMQDAVKDGWRVMAGVDSPDAAQCRSCGGQVVKRKRRRMDGAITYFYRHKDSVGASCRLRYRP